LDLLAFATISTRIGGGLMLLEISLIFPIVARALGKM
jgi:Na+/citrate or Na+/malate symporter